MWAESVVDVGLEVSLQVDGVGLGEDRLIARGGHEIDHDAVAGFEVEGFRTVGDGRGGCHVPIETDGGAEAGAFEEAGKWMLESSNCSRE